MRIDPQTIDRIKQTADVADVIGDYVSLKKKGANLWACCPFHGEKSPSFSVSPAKGIYKCFGCGKAGDSVRFIMDIEGLGYGEALRHLAKKYGIEIQETVMTDEQQQAQNERESLLIVLNYAKNYYQNNLFKHEEGQSIGYPYFKERGFSDKTINTFELGYSLESWDAFTKEAIKNGYSLEILEKAGLTIVKGEAPPAPEGEASTRLSDSEAPPSGAGGAVLYRPKHKVVILVKELNPADSELLGKILGAVQLTLQNVEIIEMSKNPSMDLSHIFTQKSVSQLISFGVMMSEVNLMLRLTPYQILESKGVKFISGVSLSDLQNDIPKKKALWGALKEMF